MGEVRAARRPSTAEAGADRHPSVLMFAPCSLPGAFSEHLANGKLGLAMLQAGWDVQVVTQTYGGKTYGNEWAEPWLPLQPVTSELTNEGGVTAARLADVCTAAIQTRYVGTGTRWARRAIQRGRELLRTQEVDVILSRSPTEGGHLPALALAGSAGLPWIANFNDPPCWCFPRPYRSAGGLWRWSGRSLLRRVLREADVVTFPSGYLRDYVVAAAGMRADIRTAVVPHCGLAQRRGPPPPGRNQVLRLCHAGDLKHPRDPTVLIHGLRRFRAEVSADVQLDLIGLTDDALRGVVGEAGLGEAVRFLGAMPYRQADLHMLECDALVVLEAPCATGIFLPSKVADYLSAGRPVIAVSPAAGVLADLFRERVGGVAVDNTSVSDVVRGLTEVYQAWRTGRLQEVYRPLLAYERAFEPQRILDIYRTLFGEVGVRVHSE
jgi:glycosyltransferase involved in cell wall biosynthesis